MDQPSGGSLPFEAGTADNAEGATQASEGEQDRKGEDDGAEYGDGDNEVGDYMKPGPNPLPGKPWTFSPEESGLFDRAYTPYEYSREMHERQYRKLYVICSPDELAGGIPSDKLEDYLNEVQQCRETLMRPLSPPTAAYDDICTLEDFITVKHYLLAEGSSESPFNFGIDHFSLDALNYFEDNKAKGFDESSFNGAVAHAIPAFASLFQPESPDTKIFGLPMWCGVLYFGHGLSTKTAQMLTDIGARAAVTEDCLRLTKQQKTRLPLRGGEWVLHGKGLANLQIITQEFLAAIEKSKGVRNKHLYILSDSCLSGRLVADLDNLGMQFGNLLKDRNCSITVQASCGPDQLARSSLFTSIITSPSALDMWNTVQSLDDITKQQWRDTWKDYIEQQPCFATIGADQGKDDVPFGLWGDNDFALFLAFINNFWTDLSGKIRPMRVLEWDNLDGVATNILSNKYKVNDLKVKHDSYGQKLAMVLLVHNGPRGGPKAVGCHLHFHGFVGQKYDKVESITVLDVKEETWEAQDDRHKDSDGNEDHARDVHLNEKEYNKLSIPEDKRTRYRQLFTHIAQMALDYGDNKLPKTYKNETHTSGWNNEKLWEDQYSVKNYYKLRANEKFEYQGSSSFESLRKKLGASGLLEGGP